MQADFQYRLQKPALGARLDPSCQFADRLAGFWVMNEYSGDIAFDSSLNGRNATFKNDGSAGSYPSWETVYPGFTGPTIGFSDATGERLSVPRVTLSQGHAGAIWFTRSGANNRDSVIFASDGSTLRYMCYIAPNGANVDVIYRNNSGLVTLVTATGAISNDSRPQFMCVSQDEDGEVELWHGNYNTMLFQSLGTASRTGATWFESLNNYDSTTERRAGFLHFYSMAAWDRPISAAEAESLFYDPWQGIASDRGRSTYVAAPPATTTPQLALLGVGV